jgi:hypothetical protein
MYSNFDTDQIELIKIPDPSPAYVSDTCWTLKLDFTMPTKSVTTRSDESLVKLQEHKMKKSFSARRVPRKIGQDEEDEDISTSSNATSNQSMYLAPVITQMALTSYSSWQCPLTAK